nr:hypothetical protein [uncultured Methanoregula sp.]
MKNYHRTLPEKFRSAPVEKIIQTRPGKFQPAPPPLPGSCVPIKKFFRKNFQPDFHEKILKKKLPEKFSAKKIKISRDPIRTKNPLSPS